MPKQVILLSGRVGSGKTSLGDALRDEHQAVVLKTRQLIKSARPDVAEERRALQIAGDELDAENAGWITKELRKIVDTLPDGTLIVVDAVRRVEQIDAIRGAFGGRVIHVHLTAATEVLAKRYAERHATIAELPSYDEVSENPTEASVESLGEFADVFVETDQNLKADVLVRVAARVGLYDRTGDPLVDVLVGGEFGSEGKGHIASYLAPSYDILVRVGGPNAGHTVYFEPEPYTYHSLPSGSGYARNALLVIGPGATLWVPGLQKEIADEGISYDRLAIDPKAMIIEESDRAFEAAHLKDSIASTAQGGGYATARRVMRHELGQVRLAEEHPDLKPYLRETRDIFERAYRDGKRILLEGTQGTGLSLYHGWYPHVTSRDTTVSGCLAEAGIAPRRVRRVVMVCRTYPIRVQDSDTGNTSGFMSQGLTWDIIAARSGIPLEELLKNEKTSTTKRQRRVSEFDWDLLRRAAMLNGPTDVALTFADYLCIKNREARRFEQLTDDTIKFIEEVERVSGAPVSLISTRFHSRSIIDRRRW